MEYIKDRKIKKEDIRQLLEWVEKQSHMPRVTGIIFIFTLFDELRKNIKILFLIFKVPFFFFRFKKKKFVFNIGMTQIIYNFLFLTHRIRFINLFFVYNLLR